MTGALASRALALLRENDAGSFVRPGPGLYPFQWNWDSAFVALGLARVDPERGRREIRSLLRGQWTDGMVPHIVFHERHDGYFPGPDVWSSSRCRRAPSVPTSGITQPPVLATSVRALHEADPDARFLEEVVPALEAWHAWFHRERALDGSRLVAVLHPWEAADNSPRFDAALARIAVDDAPRLARTDRLHAGEEERPTDLDYRRYLLIVECLRRSGYRPAPLAEAPFVYPDLCLNSILAVAEADLAWLSGEVGEDGARARRGAEQLGDALRNLWNARAAVYRVAGPGAADTVDDLFPLYAGVADSAQARRLFEEALWAPDRFGPSPQAPWAVTSVSKASPAYDPSRYWRGPVWINVNWFLVRGLERSGLTNEAAELRALTLGLLERSGFSEYYHPETGAPLGSRSFSWSAALALDLLRS